MCCFARGGLRHLTGIVILESHELTMAAVESLLRSCPYLRSLGEMEGWEGVSAAEIAGLRARIRDNNWDLDIDWTWSGY